MRAAAILPAAGSGSRLGGTPKQLRMLGDAPVLVHAARAVLAGGLVEHLVVAAPAGEADQVAALLVAYDLGAQVEAIVVKGGDTRQASVAAGLTAVPESADVILVHDAARPFLPTDRLEAVVVAALDAGAAALAIPVSDTLRHADGGHLGDTVSRDGVWAMQTPQAARADLLRAAFDAAIRDGFVGTDEVELLTRTGVDVRLVHGDARNVKLTTAGDWAVAEALFRMRGSADPRTS